MAEEGDTRGRPPADPLRGDGGPQSGAKRRSTELGSKGGESGKKQKISVSLSSKKTGSVTQLPSGNKAPAAPIAIKLSAKSKPKEPDIKPTKSLAVSKVFGDDSSEDEEEEMPPEAKMRMKNLGRMTATSAGPKSFNKGKDGFTSNAGRAWRLKKEDEIAKQEHEKWLRENKELEGAPL